MGTRWGRRFGRPDAIVSSPALRAITTARLVAERLGYPAGEIVVEPRLYDAGTDTLVALVEALDDRWERVMLVGHNPALSDLARRLDAGIASMPPCGLAEFAFDIASWSGFRAASPQRARFDSPSHPDE
jgi:phosphohistidine phosphatase